MAHEMRENGTEAARDLHASLGELGNVLGQTLAPTLEAINKGLTSVVHAITDWLTEHPKLAQALGTMALVVAIGATALAGLTSILAAGVAAQGMFFLAAGTTSFVVALAPLASAALPILAVASAFGAVTLAVVQLVKAWDTLDLGETLKGLTDAFGDGSVWKTMTLNPFSGLGGDSAPTAPTLGAAHEGAHLTAPEAPKGKIEIVVEGAAKIKNPPRASGGIELEATAGLVMQ